MLKRHEVEWVKRLAEQGLSRRKIALKTGFARDTVRKILDGRRPDYDALRRERGGDDEPLFSGPIERCPTCGSRVYMPCMACKVRLQSIDGARKDTVAATDLVARRRRKIALERSKQSRHDEGYRRRAA